MGSWPDIFPDLGTTKIEAEMDAAGIGKAVISSLSEAFGAHVPTDANSDRLVPFRSAGPDHDLNDLAQSENIKGVRIYPSYQAWDFQSPTFSALIDLVKSRNWVLQVYLRLWDSRVVPTSEEPSGIIAKLKPVVQSKPGLKLAFSGINFPEIRDNAEFIEQSAWVDISHLHGPTTSLQMILGMVSASRVLFGSNMPTYYPYAGVYRLENESISNFDRRLIACGNAKNLLDL